MREHITDALEIFGAVSITAGFGFWLGIAGALITGGIFMIVGSYLLTGVAE